MAVRRWLRLMAVLPRSSRIEAALAGDQVVVGFEGVEEIGHGLGEVFATDSAGDEPHVLQDLDRVVGVFGGLGLASIDHGRGRPALGLADSTHELLAGVVAVAAGDVGDGIKDNGFLSSSGLGIRHISS